MVPRALARFEGWRSALGKGLVFAWGAVALVGISSLSVSHMAAMPDPGKEDRLVRAALSLRTDESRPFRLHVIYEKCSCTERLFAHLVERGAVPGLEETVLFVGKSEEKRLAAERAGFRFTTVAAADLEKVFTLQSAPVLLAFDRAGTLQYAGGYFDQPAAVRALDLKVYAELSRNAKPHPLPIFGCAVSPGLQKRVDPLGVVYS